ncbi:uncharacterized protein EV154DRAFT_501763 [Mucor mucedo]|uniref:uncharacterized protein n=1 Tax=Mucor mucedo TaxID=29922 RepID=UPI0022204075|nr:uncharacterized protein EV154DRAFT_501763 [Mucor mucedo]KAI7893352.1 hypothetical protein EV154DRAFT_501763 [Mucor mucedo]
MSLASSITFSIGLTCSATVALSTGTMPSACTGSISLMDLIISIAFLSGMTSGRAAFSKIISTGGSVVTLDKEAASNVTTTGSAFTSI